MIVPRLEVQECAAVRMASQIGEATEPTATAPAATPAGLAWATAMTPATESGVRWEDAASPASRNDDV